MRIDVFTLVPQAFAWMCEQRPVAAVLGSGLDLRILGYRQFSPLERGQVDDAPYGGGAGMVLRVDVVDAALQGVYGPRGARRSGRRVIALAPGGRQLDQELVEELAEEEEIALLSARFEGFDARVLEHLVDEALSIGPYVLSGGEIPAMVVVDAIARRLPGSVSSSESVEFESFAAGLQRRVEHPHYTRPATHRGWSVPGVLLSGDHARIAEWRRSHTLERSSG
ncbi:MAG: tRNA (guanosine(37)-N1)-methyltransferase TrmD [Gaiellales bacterium]